MIEILALAFGVLGSLSAMIWVFEIHRRPSIVGTVFITLFLMYGVTAIPFLHGQIEGEVANSLPVSPHFAWVLTASFVFYALGATITAKVGRYDLRSAQVTFFGDTLHEGKLNKTALVVTGCAAAAVGLLYAFGAGPTGIALLAEQSREAGTLREFRMGFQETNPYYYWGSLVNNVFGPILLLVSVNLAVIRRSPTWAVLGVCLLGLLVLTSTASLHKAPLAILLLFLVFNRGLGAPGQRAGNAARLWLPALLLLAGIGLGGYYLTYEMDLSEAWDSTVNRLLVVPLACVNGFLYVYPDMIDFNYGMGIGLVAKLFGVTDYVNPPFAVGQIVTGSSEAVSANAFWSTELWASFGYPGVIVGSFLVGGMMLALDRWCLGRRRTATRVALYAFMLGAAIKLPSVSLFTTLLSGGLGLGPLFVLALEARWRWSLPLRSRPRGGAGHPDHPFSASSPSTKTSAANGNSARVAIR